MEMLSWMFPGKPWCLYTHLRILLEWWLIWGLPSHKYDIYSLNHDDQVFVKILGKGKGTNYVTCPNPASYNRKQIIMVYIKHIIKPYIMDRLSNQNSAFTLKCKML